MKKKHLIIFINYNPCFDMYLSLYNYKDIYNIFIPTYYEYDLNQYQNRHVTLLNSFLKFYSYLYLNLCTFKSLLLTGQFRILHHCSFLEKNVFYIIKVTLKSEGKR